MLLILKRRVIRANKKYAFIKNKNDIAAIIIEPFKEKVEIIILELNL